MRPTLKYQFMSVLMDMYAGSWHCKNPCHSSCEVYATPLIWMTWVWMRADHLFLVSCWHSQVFDPSRISAEHSPFSTWGSLGRVSSSSWHMVFFSASLELGNNLGWRTQQKDFWRLVFWVSWQHYYFGDGKINGTKSSLFSELDLSVPTTVTWKTVWPSGKSSSLEVGDPACMFFHSFIHLLNMPSAC